jgi:hypothetical protein
MLRLKRKMVVYVMRDLASIHPLGYIMMGTILIIGLTLISQVA